MGIVLAIGFLASALMDVAIGAGLRRLIANPRSASRLQLIGAILCSTSLGLVLLGAWLPWDVRFAYSIGAGLLFRLSYALYDVPQNALMALATTDAASRSRLASIRIWFSGVATLMVAAAVGPLVGAHGTAAGLDLLFLLAGLFAIVAIGSAWHLNGILRGVVKDAADSPRPTLLKGGTFPIDFCLLLVVMLATSLFTPIFSKVEPYFATYVLQSPWWGGTVVVLMAVGIIIGQPLWMRMSRHLSYGGIMLLTALLQLTALLAFWSAGSEFPLLLAVLALLFGLGNGGVGMVQWAAFSETVTRMGPERAGTSYGLFSGAAKLAQAAGGLLLGVALAGIDLNGPEAQRLVIVMTLIPGLGALCVALAAAGLMWNERRISTGKLV